MTALEQPLAEAFARETGDRVRFTFGASGMLARQIEQGAPYDVFLSANENFVADLARAGRVDPASVRVYAEGRLGLWSRSGAVKAIGDLRKPGVLHLAIANPAHAPYGIAARALLERGGLWRDVQPKVVYGENVRQALQFAESGNADAVITAWSLLIGRPGAVLLPAEGHNPIRQAGAVVTRGPHTTGARRFLDFLSSPTARRILTARGFTIPAADGRR